MYKYGWKRDLPDHRDFKFTYYNVAKLPPFVDLSPNFPQLASDFWVIKKAT
jgi:hypothetical protein